MAFPTYDNKVKKWHIRTKEPCKILFKGLKLDAWDEKFQIALFQDYGHNFGIIGIDHGESL